MEPINLGGHVEEQLQLGKEGEVVGGDVGVRAAGDIVLYEPVVVQRAQDAQHVQLRLRVENIVNDTLGRGGGGEREEKEGVSFGRPWTVLTRMHNIGLKTLCVK